MAPYPGAVLLLEPQQQDAGPLALRLRDESVLGLDVFGALRVQQVVVGDPLQVEVLVAQVVLATEMEGKFDIKLMIYNYLPTF